MNDPNDLPACPYRGPVAASRCPCTHPKVRSANGIVPVSLCRICVQRPTEAGLEGGKIDPPAVVRIVPPPPEPQALLPCVYRGEVLRLLPCELCGSRGRTVPVHTCELKGECTPTRVSRRQSLPLCTTCPDRMEA